MKLGNGRAAIKLSDHVLSDPPKPHERLPLRITVGNITTAVETGLAGRRFAPSPYEDKNERLKRFANAVRQEGAVENTLDHLAKACMLVDIPTGSRHTDSTYNTGYNFIHLPDRVMNLFETPPLMTPGELLSLPTYEPEVSDSTVIPVKIPFELHILFAGALRTLGVNAHVALLDKIIGAPFSMQDKGGVVILDRNAPDILITSPNLLDLSSDWIHGVEIMDEATALALLRLNCAEDAALILNFRTVPVIMGILEEIDRKDVIEFIKAHTPVMTAIGPMPLKPERLTDQDLGTRVLGREDYNALAAKMQEWMTATKNAFKGLFNAMADSIAGALRLDPNAPFNSDMINSALSHLAARQITHLKQELEKRGIAL